MDSHPEKIQANWQTLVSDEDIVLIPGDISWGKTLEESRPDYEFLSSLPGFKVIVKGNHDFSLTNVRKAQSFLSSLDTESSRIRLIHKNSMVITWRDKKVGIAGTRGWSRRGGEKDEKILERELRRMKLSIQNLPPIDRLVVITHFPPTDKIKGSFLEKLPESNPGDENYREEFDDRMFELIAGYMPALVVCGHVHTYRIINPTMVDDIPIFCVSADTINFDPIELPLD